MRADSARPAGVSGSMNNTAVQSHDETSMLCTARDGTSAPWQGISGPRWPD